MNKKEVFVIFAICLLFFTPYFIRPSFIGADSYFYLNNVCFSGSVSDRGSFEVFVLDLLPCDFFVLKLIQFFVLFVTILFLVLLVEEFFKDKSFWVTVFGLGMSPILFFVMFKFENDFFSIPLLVLAILFYFKSLKNKYNTKFFVYSMVSVSFLFFSAQFYGLTWFFVFVGMLSNPLFLVISILTIIIGYDLILTKVFLPFFVMETLPIIGLTSLFLFVTGFFKPLHKKEIIISTILLAIQGRFMIFIPFVFMPSIINLFEKLKPKINLYHILGVWAIMGLLGFGLLSFYYFPSQETLNITQESISLQKDLDINLYNDWELGHFITFYGYPAKHLAGPPNPDYNNLEKPFIALTIQNLNCKKVRKTNEYTLYLC